MQENVKTVWRERLYASASAVALGCLLPVSGNAGAIDIVSGQSIDPAIASIPRISAPARWATYAPEPKVQTQLVALAVPVPAMAPAPLPNKATLVAVKPKHHPSPLELAWSSPSPSPKPSFVEEASAKSGTVRDVHEKHASKPKKKAVKTAAKDKKHKVKVAGSGKKSHVLLPKIAATPKKGPTPLEVIAEWHRHDVAKLKKIANLRIEQPQLQPEAELADAREAGAPAVLPQAVASEAKVAVQTPPQLLPPAEPSVKTDIAEVSLEKLFVPMDALTEAVSNQKLWDDFDNSLRIAKVDDVADSEKIALVSPETEEATPVVHTELLPEHVAAPVQHVVKSEPPEKPKPPEKVVAVIKEIKPSGVTITQASLIQASQETAMPLPTVVEESAGTAQQTITAIVTEKEVKTATSPLAITFSPGLWQDFDKTGEPAEVAVAKSAVPAATFEPGTLEPAAGGEPISLMPPSAPREATDVKQDLPILKALPSVPEEEEITAKKIDAIDPVATPVKKSKVSVAEAKAELSAESRAILDSLPPQLRTGTAPKKNVKLDRSNKAGSGEDAVKKHEAYGMKISVKRPKVDVFRMLESAYNSLIAGDQQYAITLYKEVLDEEPDNTLALFGLATTYHRAGQTTLARPFYARLLEIDPHNVEGLNNFLVLLADEAPDAALQELEKLRHSHPNFSPVLAQMALIHERRGEYNLAAQKLAQANSISPENLKYQYNMAIVLDKMKDWPEASRWYQRLLTASERGEKIPGNPQEIQQRLTFIRSNTSNVN